MKMKSLEVTINANTTSLSAKLRAIAKHSEALAKELEAIDNTCDDCGGPITKREEYFNYKLINTYSECERCQKGECIPNK